MTFQRFAIAGKAKEVFKLIEIKTRMEPFIESIEKEAQERRHDAHRINSARIVDKEFHDCHKRPGARCNTPFNFDCVYAVCPVLEEKPVEMCRFKENTPYLMPLNTPCSQSGCLIWRELFSDLEVS